MTEKEPHPWSNPQDDDDVAEDNLGDPRDMTLPAPRAKTMSVKDELVWAQRIGSLGDKATAEKLRELGMPKAGFDAYVQHREDTRVAEQWAIRAEWLAYREGKTIEQAMSSLAVALGPLTVNQSAVLRAHWVYGERHADWVCQLQLRGAVKGELQAAQPNEQSLPRPASVTDGKPLVTVTRPDGKRVSAEIEASWRLPECAAPCWANARHNGKLESYYWGNGQWFFNEPEPWSAKDIRDGGMIRVYPALPQTLTLTTKHDGQFPGDDCIIQEGDYVLARGGPNWFRVDRAAYLKAHDGKTAPSPGMLHGVELNGTPRSTTRSSIMSHKPCPRIRLFGNQEEIPVERMWEDRGLAWVNAAGSGWYRAGGVGSLKWLPFGRRYREAPRGGDANGFVGDNHTEQRTWPPLDIEPFQQPMGDDLSV